ncbi:Thioesterase-like superfamily protein [Bosea sp. OK403]|jgi:acyl-CoA thioester hydrolase|uniref:acyl-CoA thioesterase n=1 Tax=Bosea sp. OK403 TaxID=1855286 RepID=UPI0008E02BF7|nr:acyl-CoA thioesterase [Bosea sp. OK403]SFJ73881.1 Thioesterase-like superfamily protein [Bosea sp. OK403]
MPLIPNELFETHAIETGWRFGVIMTAQWRDLDAFGHVNHRTHLAWCEEARNRYLEAVGLPPLAFDSPGPVLKSISFNYDRALGYGDEIVATAAVVSMRRTSFRMRYAVWHHGCVGRGDALAVLMLNSTGEKIAIPPEVRSRILEMDQPQED